MGKETRQKSRAPCTAASQVAINGDLLLAGEREKRRNIFTTVIPKSLYNVQGWSRVNICIEQANYSFQWSSQLDSTTRAFHHCGRGEPQSTEKAQKGKKYELKRERSESDERKGLLYLHRFLMDLHYITETASSDYFYYFPPNHDIRIHMHGKIMEEYVYRKGGRNDVMMRMACISVCMDRVGIMDTHRAKGYFNFFFLHVEVY